MDAYVRIVEQEVDLLCMIEDYARSGALQEDKEYLEMAVQLSVEEQYRLIESIRKSLPPSWSVVSWNTSDRKEIRIAKHGPYPTREIIHAWYVVDEADWQRQKPSIVEKTAYRRTPGNTDYSPDCRPCLSGCEHTEAQHEQSLSRNHVVSWSAGTIRQHVEEHHEMPDL